MRTILITQAELKKLLSYDPKTGVFRWRKTGKGRNADRIAGNTNNHGYRALCIRGKRYQAHRLAWLYVHGVWPAGDLDHRNGVRDDNRIKNLRQATRSQNMQNKSLQANNTSGYKGVCWNIGMKKWQANIRLHGKRKFLGYFSNIEDAASAYASAASELHGEFANTT